MYFLQSYYHNLTLAEICFLKILGFFRNVVRYHKLGTHYKPQDPIILWQKLIQSGNMVFQMFIFKPKKRELNLNNQHA